MGCAILVISAITGEKPFDVAERFWQYGTPIRPNPAHMEIYNKKYKTYKTLRKLYMEQRSK